MNPTCIFCDQPSREDVGPVKRVVLSTRWAVDAHDGCAQNFELDRAEDRELSR